jgi:primosomal replication protein N
MRNEIRISAQLVACSQMRFTPAGVAVVEARFEHRSEVVEAGRVRTLDFGLDALAIEAAARRVVAFPLGAEVELSGFLAPRSRRSKRLVLHVVAIEDRRVEVDSGMNSVGQDLGSGLQRIES